MKAADRRRQGVVFWAALLAGTIMLIAIAVTGCGHVPSAPTGALEAAGLQRVYCVARDRAGRCVLLRSPQPHAAQFRAIVERYGVGAVVKLNSAIEGRDALPDGVELLHHPWAPAGPVSHDAVTAALDDLDAELAAGRVVLVHCSHGEDRTGLLVGLWRVRHSTPVAAARGEMRAYGFHEDLIGLVETWERETGEKD